MDTLELRDISYSFENKSILENVSLVIKKGSIHSLIGISGSGKSTTLKIISKLLTNFSGKIENLPEKVTFAFQKSPLIPWLSVKENLRICTTNFSEVDDYLKLFHLESISALYPSELSGGMIQKINILRSFLGNPDLILMDEPFVHIDSIQKEDLHHFLLKLWRKSQPTIIFVTHDIDEAIYLSQNISLLSMKKKNITETLDASKKADSFLELKNSENYSQLYKKIYNHLKQDQIV